MNLLIVYFKVRASHQKFHAVIFFIYKTKDLGETVRDNSSHLRIGWDTKHGVSFTTACLAVSKDGSVVPLDDRLDKRESSFVVDSLLLGICIVN